MSREIDMTKMDKQQREAFRTDVLHRTTVIMNRVQGHQCPTRVCRRRRNCLMSSPAGMPLCLQRQPAWYGDFLKRIADMTTKETNEEELPEPDTMLDVLINRAGRNLAFGISLPDCRRNRNRVGDRIFNSLLDAYMEAKRLSERIRPKE